MSTERQVSQRDSAQNQQAFVEERKHSNAEPDRLVLDFGTQSDQQLSHSTASHTRQHSVLHLQGIHGNQAVQRMLAMKAPQAFTHKQHASFEVSNVSANQRLAAPESLRTIQQTANTAIQRDISTPLPQGAQVQRNGSANLQIAQVQIRLLPDRRTRNRRMTGRAETRARLSWGMPGCRFGRDGTVSRINPMPAITMRIQTTYGPTVTAQSSSAYGRGTTPADVQTGDTSLGFHEGNHGLDFMDYLRNNPLPVFTGTVGMTKQQYNQAKQQYSQEMHDYQIQMDAYSEQHTDCVGTRADFCPSP